MSIGTILPRYRADLGFARQALICHRTAPTRSRIVLVLQREIEHVDRTYTCYYPRHLLAWRFSGRFGGYGYGFGHGGIGVIGIILIILVVLLLMGRI